MFRGPLSGTLFRKAVKPFNSDVKGHISNSRMIDSKVGNTC